MPDVPGRLFIEFEQDGKKRTLRDPYPLGVGCIVGENHTPGNHDTFVVRVWGDREAERVTYEACAIVQSSLRGFLIYVHPKTVEISKRCPRCEESIAPSEWGLHIIGAVTTGEWRARRI